MVDSVIKFSELEKEEIDEFNEYRDGVLGRMEEDRSRECTRGEELRKRLNRITS